MHIFNAIRVQTVRPNGIRNGNGKLLPWPGQARSGNGKEIDSTKSKIKWEDQDKHQATEVSKQGINLARKQVY